jgi:hypothetical protein
MTDDDRSTDWPDDRLADAFHARTEARPTPSDLSAATIDRIRRVPTVALRRLRLARVGGLVAVAAVIAIVAIALVARPLTDRIADEGSTFGLPVLGVSEAIAIRDRGVDDRELAVHGFYATFGAMPCPAPTDMTGMNNPTRLWCQSAATWLMEQPERLNSRTSTSVVSRPPTGPAIQPGLDLVEPTGFAPNPDDPFAVVFIGHFDDRRADFCPADVQPACADTFIVDRINRGYAMTDKVRGDAGINALISRVDPSLLILSRRVVPIEDLGSMEPVYAATGGVPSYVSNAAWLVTALPPVDANGRAIVRTFVIFDGTDVISEITRSGIVDVTLSAGASPSPSSTAFGLSILSVSEAIAVHDADSSDREIAVRGYFLPANLGLRCGATRSINPVWLRCPFDTQWLLDTPMPLEGIRTSLPPGRIGFQPLLPGLDTSGLYEAADRGLNAGSLVEVVLIGHFHDRRGHPALCDVADASACDGFVSDGIYSVGDARIPPSSIVQVAASGEPDVGLTWTADDVDRLILGAVPRLQILSRVALAGSEIASLEPALGTGALGIIDRPFAWLVTGLDPGTNDTPPVRRTFLLVDGTAEAYESAPWDVSNVGFIPFQLIGLPLASEEPSPSPPSPN